MTQTEQNDNDDYDHWSDKELQQLIDFIPNETLNTIHQNSRTSSLFTAGNGEPIPMQEDQHEDKASIDQPVLQATPSTQEPHLVSESSQPPPPPSIQLPRRTLSLFHTGGGDPIPLEEEEEEKGSGSNQACPVFGFQTARGTSVSAPSEQSMRKALDLCTTNLTPLFPKRPYKEPESPSPSHRAKIQKSSPSQAPVSSGTNIKEAATGECAHDVEDGANITTNPSVGLFSTGAGAPVNISASAIEHSRAYLDDPTRSSELKQPSSNHFNSPLKDVSNLPPNSSHNHLLNMKADLLVGSHQSDRPISITLSQSLNAITAKIPSQPTTAASLMSTPIRTIPKMSPSSGIPRKPIDELNWIPPTTVPHAAPVRRISNRMHIGLTPQSSRRVSHEGKPVQEPRPFVTPFKKSNLQGFPSTSKKTLIPSNHSPFMPHVGDTQGQVDTPFSDHTRRRVMYMEPIQGLERQNSGTKHKSVYDLQRRNEQNKIPMKEWLGPYKGYTARNLLSLAIPESVVFMTSKSSLVWTFNPLTDPFGSIHALDQLLKAGCTISRASPTWVANHWGLIIWKLAAIVRWRPDSFSRIWNPSHVVKQLKYRYEREFIYGHRSIVKRILDRDCPANIPMCLVIVGIVRRDHNDKSSTQQVIELSDGWYKIQAVLDPVLTRALKRGALKVGFKLAIFGASTEMIKPTNNNKPENKKKNVKESKKEEKEDEEEEESRIYLEGNCTSRAKCTEMLGFRSNRKPWFASLKSITFDGGKVPLLDLIVVKIFQPTFLDDGDRRIALQSWNFSVESKLRIAWENERAKELENIRNEERVKLEGIEKIYNKIDSLLCGTKPSPTKRSHKKKISDDGEGVVGEDNESNHSQSSTSQFDAEEMCEELIEEQEDNNDNDENEDSWYSKISQISLKNLDALRVAFETKIVSMKNSSADLVQKKLDMRVPIRRTREIQVLQVEDYSSSCSIKNKSSVNKRSAQLVVKDLSKLPDGFFKLGNRYWVQNVQPQKNTSWDISTSSKIKSNFNASSHLIFLTTRKDSHWIPVGLNH